jgi:hypothetical protein
MNALGGLQVIASATHELAVFMSAWFAGSPQAPGCHVSMYGSGYGNDGQVGVPGLSYVASSL